MAQKLYLRHIKYFYVAKSDLRHLIWRKSKHKKVKPLPQIKESRSVA
jgi:hypothetical protein